MQSILNSLEQPPDPEASAPGVSHLVNQSGSHQEVQQVVESQALWVAHCIAIVVKDGAAGAPLTQPYLILPPCVSAAVVKDAMSQRPLTI